uniref:Uncharacterized protein n=1 Tax=Plectus sambesii TaxID=2011161 RepID=A0A914XBY3_9BILA
MRAGAAAAGRRYGHLGCGRNKKRSQITPSRPPRANIRDDSSHRLSAAIIRKRRAISSRSQLAQSVASHALSTTAVGRPWRHDRRLPLMVAAAAMVAAMVVAVVAAMATGQTKDPQGAATRRRHQWAHAVGFTVKPRVRPSLAC